MNSYSMEDRQEIGDKGIEIVTAYLKNNKRVNKIVNVENYKEFQKKDIDILVNMNIEGIPKWVAIEVKCDSYASGNLYVETISNMNKNTLGCLMYSEAHYLFYYFEKYQDLYILPMKKFRNWFKDNIKRFNKKNLFTKLPDGKILYESEGYTVPLKIIKQEFRPLRIIHF